MKTLTKAIAGPSPGTEEWNTIRLLDEDRQQVTIGASEAASACGVSPYNTPLGLYLQKRGEIDRNINAEEEHLRFGTLLEPVIVSEYERRLHVKVETGLPMYLHETYSFMSATPDGVVKNGRKPTEVGVECKTTSFRMLSNEPEGDLKKFGREGSDEVPVDYFMQAQQQMAVLGWIRVDIPVLVDGRNLKIYQIERHDSVIGMIAENEKELSERILNGDPPEPNWEHSQTKDLLRQMYQFDDGTTTVLSDDALRWANLYSNLGERIRTLTSRREECRNRLVSEVGNHNIGVLPDGRSVKRTVIPESQHTLDDAVRAMRSVGETKRSSYERIYIRSAAKQG